MVHAFAARRNVPVHIVHGEQTKILSYRPETASGGSLCLHVFGDHAFFVSDPHTKSVLAKMKTQSREPASNAVLAVLHRTVVPPSTSWQEWKGQREPGHYFAHDLNAARVQLHAAGICPKVTLNGAGVPKALRVPTGKESAVIHRWLPEGALCEAFCRRGGEEDTAKDPLQRGVDGFLCKQGFCSTSSDAKAPKAAGGDAVQGAVGAARS